MAKQNGSMRLEWRREQGGRGHELRHHGQHIATVRRDGSGRFFWQAEKYSNGGRFETVDEAKADCMAWARRRIA